jgi:hypothetical protein
VNSIDSHKPGWATVVSIKESKSCSVNRAVSFGIAPKICYEHEHKSAEFLVMSFPQTLEVPKGTTLTVNGPAKSGSGFELLNLAMGSKGSATFIGATQLYDQGKLLATITGGSLPGTLHFTATAAGQNYGRKCVDDSKTMKAAGITCSAAKAVVGCSHDLHVHFPKMPAGSLVSTICRVTCKACFSEPTRAGTVTKKVGGGKAVLAPKDLVFLPPPPPPPPPPHF